MRTAIQGLKPERVWEYFYEISQIPHGSKNEKAIREYVISVANKLNLETKQDDVGNIVVLKPASKDVSPVITLQSEMMTSEDACPTSYPVIILQSHLDMVCEKNKDVVHDFLKDPLKLKRDGDWLSADGTTLGSDNGIGVAISLALMEAKNLVHGELEFLFTIDEETGLTGAKALKEGFINSNILINLDTEDDGVFYIGCAGGKDTGIIIDLEFEDVDSSYYPYLLKLQGLQGGHSGANIGEGRANALKLLTRVLWDAYYEKRLFFRLKQIEGGDKHNAIPREAEAIVYIHSRHVNDFKQIITNFENIFSEEFKGIESNIKINLVEYRDTSSKVMTKDLQHTILNMLYTMPHGVISMSHDIPDLVETSTNLAAIKLNGNYMNILTSQRSSVATRLKDISNQIEAVVKLTTEAIKYKDEQLGVQKSRLIAGIKHGEGYPGWKPNLDSKVLKIAIETYEKMFGKKPEVKAIHAGLECGIISEKFPAMDMISMGPSMQGAHSPAERIYIPSVEKFWNYLLELLKMDFIT